MIPRLGLPGRLPTLTAGRQARPASAAAVLLLSASTLAESAASGSVVGALSVLNQTGPHTFTITADPDNKFAIDGTNLETAAALNYEAATSHSVTISADNGVDPEVERTFVIAVTNVLEAATLAALTLANDDFNENAAPATVIGAIQGKASGSTIELIDDAGGRVAISGTNLIVGLVATNYEATPSLAIIIRETLADSANSPRETELTVTVNDVDEVAPGITSSSSVSVAENATLAFALTANEAGTWSITGGSDADKLEISGSTLRWAGSGTKNYEAPNDSNSNNIYQAVVRITDAAGNFEEMTVSVTVTDVDDTAPTLSSPTDTVTNASTAALSVTTNEANGTLYGVVTTSATPPSAAQVKAGQNNGGTAAAWAGSLAISSTGAKDLTASALTQGTSYYSYFMHEDAAGNQSAVSAANGFTTPTIGEIDDLTAVLTGTVVTLPHTQADNALGSEYRVGLADPPDGAWTTLSASEFSSGPLTGLTDYYVQVRGTAGTEKGPASNTASFTTAYDPTDVTEVIEWWDFSNAAKVFSDSAGTTPAVAGSSVVGLVRGLKGAADLSNSSSGSSPDYISNGDLNYVDFDRATPDRLATGDTDVVSPASGDDNPYILIGAFKRGTASVSVSPANFFKADGTTNRVRHFFGGTNTVGITRTVSGSGTTGASPTSPVASDQFYVVAWHFKGTTLDVRVDGVLVANNVALNSAAISIDRFGLGAYLNGGVNTWDATTAFDGGIGEVAIMDGAGLDFGDQVFLDAETYLMDKWLP